MRIVLSPKLTDDTKLFRFVSFRQFMDLVETKQTSLSRIKDWPNTWEVPSAKLPSQHDDGPVRFSAWNHCESMFGQCWSLDHQSDAMWRIYSLQNEGVVIQRSVKKFNLLQDIKYAALGPVIYYDNLKTVLDRFYAHTLEENYERFTEAFLKRDAFKHENEVRFVTADDDSCLLNRSEEEASRFFVDLDPHEFIEGITVDPRADGRYVAVIQKYCKRSGFDFTPIKSTLYGNVYEQTRIVRKFATVKKKQA